MCFKGQRRLSLTSQKTVENEILLFHDRGVTRQASTPARNLENKSTGKDAEITQGPWLRVHMACGPWHR